MTIFTNLKKQASWIILFLSDLTKSSLYGIYQPITSIGLEGTGLDACQGL